VKAACVLGAGMSGELMRANAPYLYYKLNGIICEDVHNLGSIGTQLESEEAHRSCPF
jgi:hypothetical protein